MAKAGWDVTVVEKHSTPGGRARQLREHGFTFDMGPSWYWMPDVFERYFNQFNRTTGDYYALSRLDPSYRVYWENNTADIPAGKEKLKALLDTWEPGAGLQLEHLLKEAAYKYKIGINRFVYKPGQSLTEYMDWEVLRGFLKLDVFTSIRRHVALYFRHPNIRQLMEFPVLFLGARAEDTPALYSLMNYADVVGGTWYPAGGIYSVVDGMYRLAVEQGVHFRFNENVVAITPKKKQAQGVVTFQHQFDTDVIIASADYHFVESSLLPPGYRSYPEEYWEKRTMAPSCLLFFVGINKKLKSIRHHMLFFDAPFDAHAREIYIEKVWPANPLFYVGAPSVTDSSVAPGGCESLFFLIPIAAGLTGDDERLREHYFQLVLNRFEQQIGEPVSPFIVYKKSFAVSDFVSEYNSYRGNAYGLANTLRQTGVFRPSCRSKRLNNLFFTGQLTVPGPGVPPGIISGEVVANEVLKYFG